MLPRALTLSLVIASPLLAAPLQAPAAPPAEPPGPSAVLTDRDGHRMAVTDLAYAVEEREAGMVYVTRMPYLPLRTGRGEWRIPLAAIKTVTVGPQPRPAALGRRLQRRGLLRLRIGADGAPAVVQAAQSLGAPALDQAVVDWLRAERFTPGQGSLASEPLDLDVRLEVAERSVARPPAIPMVTLGLHDGTEVAGAPMVAGVLAGKAGAGEFRLALADCATGELKPAPK